MKQCKKLTKELMEIWYEMISVNNRTDAIINNLFSDFVEEHNPGLDYFQYDDLSLWIDKLTNAQKRVLLSLAREAAVNYLT